jgi:hypothetical protein
MSDRRRLAYSSLPDLLIQSTLHKHDWKFTSRSHWSLHRRSRVMRFQTRRRRSNRHRSNLRFGVLRRIIQPQATSCFGLRAVQAHRPQLQQQSAQHRIVNLASTKEGIARNKVESFACETSIVSKTKLICLSTQLVAKPSSSTPAAVETSSDPLVVEQTIGFRTSSRSPRLSLTTAEEIHANIIAHGINSNYSRGQDSSCSRLS